MHVLKCAAWAIGGSVVGAALAYLTAPASGTEVRRQIRRRVRDEREHLLKKGHRAVGDATGYIEKQYKEGRAKLAHVVSH